MVSKLFLGKKDLIFCICSSFGLILFDSSCVVGRLDFNTISILYNAPFTAVVNNWLAAYFLIFLKFFKFLLLTVDNLVQNSIVLNKQIGFFSSFRKSHLTLCFKPNPKLRAIYYIYIHLLKQVICR